MEKFCANCKHIMLDPNYEGDKAFEYARCALSLKFTPDIERLVRGYERKATPEDFDFCSSQRIRNTCGRDGKLFEPRQAVAAE